VLVLMQMMFVMLDAELRMLLLVKSFL